MAASRKKPPNSPEWGIESPTTLLEQLRRIHQQTVETGEGMTLTGLTEITPAQKSLFAALDLTPPTPSDLTKPVL